jgi:hypothetical protein
MSQSPLLLDQAIAEAYASAPQDTIVLHTLEINHHTLTTPIRVVRWPVLDNDPTVFHCKLEADAPYDPGEVVDFIGLPLEIVSPAQSTDNPGSFQIRVDNVGDTLDEYLENAALSGGKITAIYRKFLKGSEGDGPRSVWPGIQISSPRMEGQTLVVSGAVLDWMQRPFGRLYAPARYPQLVRSR